MIKNVLIFSSVWCFWAIPARVCAQPVEVISPGLHGAIQPQIAVAPNQRIFVAFGKGDVIYCSSSVDNGKTYLAAQEVATFPKLALRMRRGPRIVASDDRITISTISRDNGNLYAWNSSDNGQTWSHGVQINSVTHCAREGLHSMAGDELGKLMPFGSMTEQAPKKSGVPLPTMGVKLGATM
jgi:outer membrane protein assembly factor BamB